MKMTYILAFICLLFLTSQGLYAATLIESEESQSGLQKTWIDGTQLRAEVEGGEEYMLMNFTRRTMHIVNPVKEQVIDMSKVVSAHTGKKQEVETPGYTVTSKGQGPTVAGYRTEHFIVSLNGKKCFESFTSREAVQELGLEHFISGMNEMFARENSMAEGNDPCRNAENALNYQEIGLPLKLIEKDGRETYSITRIEKNVPVPAGGFSVPGGFTVIDYSLMVEQMMHSAQE